MKALEKRAYSEDFVIFLFNFIWAVPYYVNKETYFKLHIYTGFHLAFHEAETVDGEFKQYYDPKYWENYF